MLSIRGIRRFFFLLSALLIPALVGAGGPSTALPYGQTAVLFPADGRVSDLFGSALAATGDTVAVGAPGRYTFDHYGDGAAYIFRRGPDGWVEIRHIEPPAGLTGSWFGGALALDGDMLAVGAPSARRDDPGSAGARGAVYIYTGDAFGDLQATIVPPDPAEISNFGGALDLDGDTLIARTERQDGLGNAAYIFTRSGNGWRQQAKLSDPSDSYVNFGAAVAVRGEIALVGAPGSFDSPPPYDRGIVYVYNRNDGVWAAAGALSPDDGERGDQFGCAIEFDGETVVIAACAHVPADNPANRAYVFTRDGGLWKQRARLDPADGDEAIVINSLAFESDRVLLGTRDLYDPIVAPRGGAAFLFERDGATWTQTQVLRANDTEAYDSFVSTVALAGPEALASAVGKAYLNAPSHGAVYAFDPLPAGGGLAFLPAISRPALEQTTGLIAYAREATGGAFDIYLITPDGRGRSSLTQSPHNELEPAWSPDGRRLAFTRDPGELVILDVIGGTETIIPIPMTNMDSSPKWSPDGRTIAYHGYSDFYADVLLITVDGGELVNLTQTASHSEMYPDWSPDGSRLVFVDDGTLATMRPDGSDISPINGASRTRHAPDWSPDGATILYTDFTGGEDALYTIPVAGGEPRLIIENAHDGRWSPDGSQIVFTGAGWGIFRVNADGSGLSVVDPSKFARMPDWQP